MALAAKTSLLDEALQEQDALRRRLVAAEDAAAADKAALTGSRAEAQRLSAQLAHAAEVAAMAAAAQEVRQFAMGVAVLGCPCMCCA
jgi:hypothetical protein